MVLLLSVFFEHGLGVADTGLCKRGLSQDDEDDEWRAKGNSKMYECLLRHRWWVAVSGGGRRGSGGVTGARRRWTDWCVVVH